MRVAADGMGDARKKHEQSVKKKRVKAEGLQNGTTWATGHHRKSSRLKPSQFTLEMQGEQLVVVGVELPADLDRAEGTLRVNDQVH